MKGDAAIQLENEKFQRLYSGVLLTIIAEEGQAFLYSVPEENDNPREILVLESVSVSAFADENRIEITGFCPNQKGLFDRCTLDFHPHL